MAAHLLLATHVANIARNSHIPLQGRRTQCSNHRAMRRTECSEGLRTRVSLPVLSTGSRVHDSAPACGTRLGTDNLTTRAEPRTEHAQASVMIRACYVSSQFGCEIRTIGLKPWVFGLTMGDATQGVTMSAMPEASIMPEIVYHYTSMHAMMEIAKSGAIWATSVSYLNDITEQEHFLKLLRDRLPEFRKNNEIEDESIFSEIEKTDQADLSPIRNYRPFVASFSALDDSLPQWRSYCPNGNGVAIGFRVECLKRAYIEYPPLEGNPVYHPTALRRVEYVSKQSVEAIDEAIRTNIKSAHNLFAAFKGKTIVDISLADLFKVTCDRLACYYKNPSFSNESEFRLVADSLATNSETTEFRTVRSTLIPYVNAWIPKEHSDHTGEKVDFAKAAMGRRWQFIDRVVVGPTSNMKLSCNAVEMFFRKHGLYVEVNESDVPFRDW